MHCGPKTQTLSVLVVLGVSMALVSVAFIGCGKQSPPTEAGSPVPTPTTPQTSSAQAPKPLSGKRIGVSLLTKQHVFYQDLERGLRDAAKEAGAELLVESAEFDPKLQDDQVGNFVVEKVDAIILCPADSKSVGGAVKKANAAGIPVFTADIAAEEGEVVSHIASDNEQGGELAAQYLAEQLGGEGKVVIIDHPAVTSVQERVAGFEHKMA